MNERCRLKRRGYYLAGQGPRRVARGVYCGVGDEEPELPDLGSEISLHHVEALDIYLDALVEIVKGICS